MSNSKRILCVIPDGHNVGLTSVALGLVQTLLRTKWRVGFLKPFTLAHADDPANEVSSSAMRRLFGMKVPNPIGMREAEKLMGRGQGDVLMEQVVGMCAEIEDVDVLVVEGVAAAPELFYSKQLNSMLVHALDADAVMVCAPNGKTPAEMAEALEVECREYAESGNMFGVVVNKIGRSRSVRNFAKNALPPTQARDFARKERALVNDDLVRHFSQAVTDAGFRLLGALPWRQDLVAPRLEDFARGIGAQFVRHGNYKNVRVRSLSFCHTSLDRSLYLLQDDALVVTTGDRSDVIVGAAMAAVSGTRIAGILLCGGVEPSQSTLSACEKAFEIGLPLLSASPDIFTMAGVCGDMKLDVPADDPEAMEQSVKAHAERFSSDWIDSYMADHRPHRTSPAEFRNMLIRRAKSSVKRIALPEGTEPRTLQAAAICARRGICVPVLLAAPDEVRAAYAALRMDLPEGIEIIDPAKVWERYVEPLVELRRAKGMTEEQARELLRNDPVSLGTMMLKLDEVDGLVSGAVHTTANTIRPAMQFVKTAPGCKLVSSVFFMGMPDQMLVFGDCAVNINPTADDLAQIAAESAKTARAFGIEPAVAMLSYSTGKSGKGPDAELVAEATAKARELLPGVAIDGPLQYDAALVKDVAEQKAPGSPVAGRATVMIFPNLNAGNIAYKAVQRAAHVVSIGPMLQGLAKPVNDLSRGCLVEDIVYTIALTAIQAQTVQAQAKQG